MNLIIGKYEETKKRIESEKQIKKEAFLRMLKREILNHPKNVTKREIYLTIRLIIMEDVDVYKMNYDELMDLFIEYDFMISEIGLLTPKELMTIFPISKTYEKRSPVKPEPCFKDYISVYQKIQNEFPINKPIGKEKAMDFLMEYLNPYIEKFVIKFMLIINHIKRIQTGTSVLEDFAKDNDIPIFYSLKGIEGSSILISEDGKVMKMKKPKVKYMKIVKK